MKNLPLVYTLEDKFEDTLYDYQGIESLNPNYVLSRQCTYVIYLETFYNPWLAFMISSSACGDLRTHEEVILSWVQTGTGISNHITLFWADTHRDKKTRCSHDTRTWDPSFLKKVGLWEIYLPVPPLPGPQKWWGWPKVKPVLRDGKVSHSLLPQHFEHISLLKFVSTLIDIMIIVAATICCTYFRGQTQC